MTEFELDRLIDRSVASYAGEPASGLAGRVLARTRRPLRWWPVAVAAIAAALLAVVWMPLDLAVPSAPLPLASMPAVPVLPGVPVLPVVRPVLAQPVSGRPAARRTPVRRLGLSPQERRLRDFVQTYPELAKEALVEDAKRLNEPLEIAPLTIQPIVIDPLEALASGVE